MYSYISSNSRPHTALCDCCVAYLLSKEGQPRSFISIHPPNSFFFDACPSELILRVIKITYRGARIKPDIRSHRCHAGSYVIPSTLRLSRIIVSMSKMLSLVFSRLLLSASSLILLVAPPGSCFQLLLKTYGIAETE